GADVGRAIIGYLRHLGLVFKMFGIVLVNREAVKLPGETRDARTKHDARLRAAAARAEHEMIRAPPARAPLRHEFLHRHNVTGRAHAIRAADRNEEHTS